MFLVLRWLVLLTALLGGTASFAQTAGAEVQRAVATNEGDFMLLDADVDISVPRQLQQAASRGVPLFFTVELEVIRPRWYWFDKVLVDASQTWRISQNVLTRQWRASTGSLALPVDSLDDALSMVRHIRRWPFASRHDLPDGQYEGRLRVRLDVSQLPKTFQANGLNMAEWEWTTSWHLFDIHVPGDSSAAGLGGKP